MSELKPCHNDLPDRLRWWAAHCDMTNCGCRISSLMVQAADTLERCDRPPDDLLVPTSRAQPDNAPLTLEELRGVDEEPVWVVYDDDSAQWALVDAGNVADELKLTGHWGEQIVLAEHKAHIKAIYRRRPEPEGGEG